MEKLPEWNELGSAMKEKYTLHAQYLIDGHYVIETNVDNLAKKIYDNKVKALLSNTEVKEHKGIIFDI